MKEKLKILVIRFSSIGDIILTTPVIRCLSIQLNAKLDFLTNRKYSKVLETNIYIDNTYSLCEDKKVTLEILKAKEYDYIVDLQNNLKSLRIRKALAAKSFSYSKNTLKRYLLIYFGVNLLNDHIVDRYFKSVLKLAVFNDYKGIDYFLSNDSNFSFNTDQDYLCWCIGGTYEQKKLSYKQISNVVNKLKIPVLFLGTDKEKIISSKVIDNSESSEIYDLCGMTTIQQSAYLINKSKLVLTNDTGMMHIAAAFNVPIISFWGCTSPSLGFEAYMPAKDSEKITSPVSRRPCSKHGKYCRHQSNGCIKEIKSQTIYDAILRLLK